MSVQEHWNKQLRKEPPDLEALLVPLGICIMLGLYCCLAFESLYLWGQTLVLLANTKSLAAKWLSFLGILGFLLGGNGWILFSRANSEANQHSESETILHTVFKIVTLLLLTEVSLAALDLIKTLP